MCIGLPLKYPLFLTHFNEMDVLNSFSNTQIPNLIKIYPVEYELFHVDKQRDRTKSCFLQSKNKTLGARHSHSLTEREGGGGGSPWYRRLELQAGEKRNIQKQTYLCVCKSTSCDCVNHSKFSNDVLNSEVKRE
jgi:hypothetical protein